jgi:hypothetical protein
MTSDLPSQAKDLLDAFAHRSIEVLGAFYRVFNCRVPTRDQAKTVFQRMGEKGIVDWGHGAIQMKMMVLTVIADHVRERGDKGNAFEFLLVLTDAFREMQEERQGRKRRAKRVPGHGPGEARSTVTGHT